MLDYNGTIDGLLIPGVAEPLQALYANMDSHHYRLHFRRSGNLWLLVLGITILVRGWPQNSGAGFDHRTGWLD